MILRVGGDGDRYDHGSIRATCQEALPHFLDKTAETVKSIGTRKCNLHENLKYLAAG